METQKLPTEGVVRFRIADPLLTALWYGLDTGLDAKEFFLSYKQFVPKNFAEDEVHVCTISWRLSSMKVAAITVLGMVIAVITGIIVGVATKNIQTGLQTAEALVAVIAVLENVAIHSVGR